MICYPLLTIFIEQGGIWQINWLMTFLLFTSKLPNLTFTIFWQFYPLSLQSQFAVCSVWNFLTRFIVGDLPWRCCPLLMDLCLTHCSDIHFVCIQPGRQTQIHIQLCDLLHNWGRKYRFNIKKVRQWINMLLLLNYNAKTNVSPRSL